MGDRANIYLVDGDADHGIYLYTHWDGSRWPEALRKALAFGKGRWGDPQYLGRIIASQVFSDIHDQGIGGGLSTVMGDNDNPVIVVDLDQSTVSFAPEGGEGARGRWQHTVSFADFVAQKRADYPEGME